MSDQFASLIGPLLDREGGYVNNPNDPGGPTNFGITLGIARENGFTGTMQAMTRDQAIAIYQAKFWAKPGLYLISPLSPSIAAKLFDIGVNMGTGTAGQFLQRALNIFNRQQADYPDVVVDGATGPATAAALKALLRLRNGLGEHIVLEAITCLQGVHYIEIGEARVASETFEPGWFANRVEFAA